MSESTIATQLGAIAGQVAASKDEAGFTATPRGCVLLPLCSGTDPARRSRSAATFAAGSPHPIPVLLVYAALAAILTAVVAAIATRVELLPDVIDLSLIPTGSGLGSLALVSYGALRRFEPDRIGRLSLLAACSTR